MKSRIVLVAAVAGWIAVAIASRAETARGKRGIVATVHPIASTAAINAFQSGGNAIDAAIAAALTLGVVDGHNSGIGGGCFMLIRLANGTLFAIDGREMAPAKAMRDMYVRNGKADPELSQTGPLAVAVPGALAAYEHAARTFGKIPLARQLMTAAKIADDGFELDAQYVRRIEATARDLNSFPAARAIFLQTNGTPRAVGDVLKQPDLARSYRAIATNGIRWFYNGPFAKLTGAWMRTNSGILTEQDFNRYRIELRQPLITTYRGYTIVGFPPPSSGGVHVAEILNILEQFDLKKAGAGSPLTVHLTAEAMKLAFADRAFWLGDPAFARVPRGLVSKSYAAQLARRIRLDRAIFVPNHSVPSAPATDIFTKHTTHFSTADADGNWVACTATVNTSFGSKVVVPGTGIVLNNEMDDFSAQPGATNFFGLVGAEANSIAPGKRPLSSMSPTIVLLNGRPILSIGAAGGPTIISQVVLGLVNVIDFGMDLEPALAQPRFHHQWKPDELRIERSAPEAVFTSLRKLGHKVVAVDPMGAAQAVAVSATGLELLGAHDPRLKGAASGW